MTKVSVLPQTKIITILLSAIILSIIYLVFVSHTFAQKPTNPSASGKLRACQARESAIKTRLNALMALVNNQETRFSSIAARVEARYTTKLAAKGDIVPNYSTLVFDIASKKSVVDTDINKAKTDAAGFSCSLLNPKNELTTFRTDMQTVKSALATYRKSIRNLIVAVATAAKESIATQSAENEK